MTVRIDKEQLSDAVETYFDEMLDQLTECRNVCKSRGTATNDILFISLSKLFDDVLKYHVNAHVASKLAELAE